MDEIKDIERKDTILRFLSDKNIRAQAFGHNVSGERAYRRAERIVAAVHLVSNHVPADEPARRRARETGIDLLSALLALRDEMRAPESASLRGALALIRKLMSLMQMLAAGGHVSLQNASALVGALDELAVFLAASLRTPLSESVELVREEFLDAGIPLSSPHVPESPKGQARKPIKDKKREKDGIKRADKNRMRSDSITTILKAQGTLGIKDIAAHLPEYSEKMIQRELKNLVAQGGVKKTGSKRWSTYSLA